MWKLRVSLKNSIIWTGIGFSKEDIVWICDCFYAWRGEALEHIEPVGISQVLMILSG